MDGRRAIQKLGGITNKLRGGKVVNVVDVKDRQSAVILAGNVSVTGGDVNVGWGG